MAAGRKQIHLEMQGGKGNRQRIWEAIRANAQGFSAYIVARHANCHDETVRSYLQALINGKYVEVLSGGQFETQELRLIKDVGAEAPSITRKGMPITAGKGTEAMWRTLRILGEVDADELAQQASVVVSTARWTARSYLKWLHLAGYVQEVSKGKSGRLARYRLVPGKYTGPRPPMIQRIGQVFDPNLGEVVYRKAAEVDQ